MHDEFLSWQLYWCSLFDMEKAPSVDLFDPGGLVQSQALQTSDGSLRITINDPGAGQTLAARFVSNTFGSGFQHIAFITDDIIQTARRMRAAGLDILPIPSNYYVDLDARYQISSQRLRELQTFGVLLDIDSQGNEFLHFYTRAFEKRFFFEIVQRDRYSGYGAANTQVRLAAQARFRQLAMAW